MIPIIIRDTLHVIFFLIKHNIETTQGDGGLDLGIVLKAVGPLSQALSGVS